VEALGRLMRLPKGVLWTGANKSAYYDHILKAEAQMKRAAIQSHHDRNGNIYHYKNYKTGEKDIVGGSSSEMGRTL
jgi:hypothetical protein